MSIVTPEAVRLEFAPAGVATRMLGLFIDLAIQLGALLALGLVVGLTTSGGVSETAAVILTLVGLFVIILGYPVVCETLWNGRTVGKAALGLRVRTKEGAPIRFRHAAIRGALGLVDFWITLGAAATISVLVTRDSQRLGDLAAGTLVLRERTAASLTSSAFAFYPPPGWEAYAAA
ncbi:MAG: RDD family protein, partial [Acidimicrobiales bacterium]